MKPSIVRWILYLVWLVAVGLITYSMSRRNGSQGEVVAAHNLWPNHRIVPADLEPYPAAGSPLAGRYVGRPIGRHEKIRPDRLRDAPAIRPALGKVPYFLALKPEWKLADALNVGSVVALWDDSEPVVRDANVLAILTEAKGGGTVPIAVLEVDPAEAKQIEGKASQLRVLVSKFDSGEQ
jgi:hypothetical protein